MSSISILYNLRYPTEVSASMTPTPSTASSQLMTTPDADCVTPVPIKKKNKTTGRLILPKKDADGRLKTSTKSIRFFRKEETKKKVVDPEEPVQYPTWDGVTRLYAKIFFVTFTHVASFVTREMIFNQLLNLQLGKNWSIQAAVIAKEYHKEGDAHFHLLFRSSARVNVSHRPVRNSITGNFPNRIHITAINHNQSTIDLGNPVNNFPTDQQNLLIPLQIHQTSSDINNIFDINSTVSEKHSKSQRSPFLRLKKSINDIKMIATIDSAAFCSVITADLAEQCHMSINSKDTIKFLPANNVSTNSLGSATGILSFNVGSIAQQVHYKHTLPLIPGSNKLLIGTDMLRTLGLQTDDNLFIRLDKEHHTLLNAESEFDFRFAQHSIGNLDNQSPSLSDFEEQLTKSGCEIKLDDINNKLKLKEN
ncbi:hypothetical protein P9112_010077 [Eukaryota sp. TZLM1-RC]